MMGKRISNNQSPYQQLAVSRDLYDRSDLLQQIPDGILSSPDRLIDELVRMRPLVVEEQRSVRSVSSEGLPNYALGTLIKALAAGGKFNDDGGYYSRLANSRDLYERSPLLQGITDSALASPEKLIPELVELRDAILVEQRKLRNITRQELPHYALVTLVMALVAGGRIKRKIEGYSRYAGWRDLYDRSPTLTMIGNTLSGESSEDVMRELLLYRDRIAVESLAALGQLNEESDFRTHALSTLVSALYAGGAFSKKFFTRLNMSEATPLEYFLKKRHQIEPAIRNIGTAKRYMAKLDRSLFTHLKNPTKQLSDNYIMRIVKWARWLLYDPDVSLRNIYRADELAFMSVFSFRDQIDAVLPGAVERIEQLGQLAHVVPIMSRYVVISELYEVHRRYDERVRAGELFDDTMSYAMHQIDRLVTWNCYTPPVVGTVHNVLPIHRFLQMTGI